MSPEKTTVSSVADVCVTWPLMPVPVLPPVSWRMTSRGFSESPLRLTTSSPKIRRLAKKSAPRDLTSKESEPPAPSMTRASVGLKKLTTSVP